ncbi:Conjugal transfer TrbH family protein [Nitrosomonas nitrosa]|uniref:Conjugal transfer TrbH family protein n=1 Tax=Nitrosomonas nitrosa TaxID=52442 RepID=A0A8H8Z0X2_9PROT|nr:conjugal transfer protein TrbH [Nitrosomonas nitrosa]CAE6506730.1 Conjugal transfer TrbH family protein [Nitrosomonas nitrosa]
MRLRFHAIKTDNYFAYKPVLIGAAILLLLGACTMTQPYGSFIQNPLQAFSHYSKVMADDVTDQIGRLYPAASTQFAMQHPASDPFGQALIDNLRMQGYAVQETVKQDNPLLAVVLSKPIDEADEHAQQITQLEARPGLALRYIIDRSDDLYHVSILIEDLKLTRAFVVHSGQIEPAGLWVRRQQEN